MRIYQVPVCIYCKKQADWSSLEQFWFCNFCEKGKRRKEEEILWIECIPLYAKDDD